MNKKNKLFFVSFLFLILVLLPTINATDLGKVSTSNSYGEIEFLSDITLKDKNENKTSIDFLDAIKIEDRKISIDTETYPEIEGLKAKLTFKSKDYINPILCHNGLCSTAYTITKEKKATYSATVDSFSTWTLVDNTFNGTILGNMTIYNNGFVGLGQSPWAKFSMNFNSSSFVNGTVIKDWSYYAINATAGSILHTNPVEGSRNAWTNGTGIVNNSLAFWGGYVIINSSNTLKFTSEATIKFWANVGSQIVGSTESWYLTIPGTLSVTTYNSRLYCNAFNSTGQNNGASFSLTNTTAGSHHYACVYNLTRGVIEYYQDGKFLGNSTTVPTFTQFGGTNNKIRVGSRGAGFADSVNGWMDELRIYTVAIHNASEINATYTAEKVGTTYIDTYPKALWYQFNQSSGDFATDTSGNSNNGNLTNYLRPALNGTDMIFDGKDDFIQNTYSSTLNLSGSGFTLVAKAQVYGINTVTNTLIAKDFLGLVIPYRLGFISGGVGNSQHGMSVFNGSTWIGTGSSSDNRELTGEHTFIGIWNGTTLLYYVDCTLIATTPLAQNISNTAPFYIGRYQTVYFNGTISKAIVLPTGLTSTEVTTYCNSSSSNLLYSTNGQYLSEIYNASDYNANLYANKWLVTASPTAVNITLQGRAGNCTNVTSYPWIAGTQSGNPAVNYTFSGLSGQCFQYLLNSLTDTNYNNLIASVNITSNRTLYPNITTPIILPLIPKTNQNITCNTTYSLNDTETGSILFKWNKNGAQIWNETQNVAGPTNGTAAISTLYYGNFTSGDYINCTAQANNNGALSAELSSSTVQVWLWANYPICADTMLSTEIPCTMFSTALNCTSYTYSIYSNVSKIENGTLQNVEDNIYIFAFNWSGQGTYLVKFCNGDTKLITVGENMQVVGSIPIAMFILLSTGALFLLPFFARFSKNEIANLVIKRGCWAVAAYLMMLNAAIMATISSKAGLGLANEMFGYMWIFGTLGWGLLVFLVIKTLLDVLTLYKVQKQQKRMGGE